jgi:hypothetical protein
VGLELPKERGGPEPGLADDGNDAWPPGYRFIHVSNERLELRSATSEAANAQRSM